MRVGRLAGEGEGMRGTIPDSADCVNANSSLLPNGKPDAFCPSCERRIGFPAWNRLRRSGSPIRHKTTAFFRTWGADATARWTSPSPFGIMESMPSSSPVRRRLQVHPAHATVGVSGSPAAFRPYCRLADGPAGRSHVWPMRVLLVDCGLDADSRAALAWLEQHLRGRCDVQCQYVAFEASGVMQKDFAAADCVVALGEGLHIAGDWSDASASRVAGPRPDVNDGEPIRVEPAAAASGHAVLDGVHPFVARGGAGQYSGVPAGATCLLVGKMTDAVQPAICRPLAWSWRGHRGGVFCTSLDFGVNFRQPDFVRLLLNAICWVGHAGAPLD